MIAASYKDTIPTATSTPAASTAYIKCEQAKNETPATTVKENGSFYRMNKQTSIPIETKNQKSVIVAGYHCKEDGYTAYATTMDTIYDEYWCMDVNMDVKESNQLGIHCKILGMDRLHSVQYELRSVATTLLN